MFTCVCVYVCTSTMLVYLYVPTFYKILIRLCVIL